MSALTVCLAAMKSQRKMSSKVIADDALPTDTWETKFPGRASKLPSLAKVAPVEGGAMRSRAITT